MNYKYILFDLDGTIVDSRTGLRNGIMYSLEKTGKIQYLKHDQLNNCFGAPLWHAYTKYFNMSTEDADAAVKKYEEYYLSKGMFESKPFPDIIETLEKLNAMGKILVIITNGYGKNAIKVLEHFGLTKYFEDICGLAYLGADETKADVIQNWMKRRNIEDKSQVIMIGDRYFDMNAATACGIDSIGVLYGYGDKQELVSAGAARTVESPFELLKLIE